MACCGGEFVTRSIPARSPAPPPPPRVDCMFVTAEVFQLPIGSLKEVSANNRDILVTIPTSQSAMSPYLEIRPGPSNFLLPSTDGFTQLGVVLEGLAARLQAVAGARRQQCQQPLQRHGASAILFSGCNLNYYIHQKTGLDSRNGTRRHGTASIEKAPHGEDGFRAFPRSTFSIRIQR